MTYSAPNFIRSADTNDPITKTSWPLNSSRCLTCFECCTRPLNVSLPGASNMYGAVKSSVAVLYSTRITTVENLAYCFRSRLLPFTNRHFIKTSFLRLCQNYFSSYETVQSVSGARTGELNKTPGRLTNKIWLISHVPRVKLEPTTDKAV